MKKFLKENWFLFVIALFFVGITVFYIYDTNKDNLPGKKVDGKDIVFSIDDTNVSADELYETLYSDYGKSQLLLLFQKAVVNAKISNSAVASAVDYYVNYYQQMYSQYYGYTAEDLDQMYQSYGYENLEDYIRFQLKANEVCTQYVKEHAEELVTDEIWEKTNPRIISYCLIKFADASNVTENDNERLKAAQDAWASGEYSADNFADFCAKFSEDSSATPSNGNPAGYLGYVDVNSSLVQEFLDAALALQEGEVSEWITATGTDYSTYKTYRGYWLIKCDSTSKEDLIHTDDFAYQILSNSKDNLANKIIWMYAEEAGVKFADENVKNYIMEAMGLTESEAE